MSKKEAMITVKQLSNMAGVTIRTLHHYDEIGLLKPSSVGDNGYRYYEEEAVYRLQQIMFYRELDMPLSDIKRILENSHFDILTSLEEHRSALQGQAERIERLIQTVDKTILHLKGKKKMSSENLFEGFSEEEQEKYAAEAERLYDPKTVRASNKKWKAYSYEEKKRIISEGRDIYIEMIAAMPKGSASAEVQSLVERWRKNIGYFWTPDLDQLLALAIGYNDDTRFRTNFEKMDPLLAQFMCAAVRVYVKKHKRY